MPRSTLSKMKLSFGLFVFSTPHFTTKLRDRISRCAAGNCILGCVRLGRSFGMIYARQMISDVSL